MSQTLFRHVFLRPPMRPHRSVRVPLSSLGIGSTLVGLRGVGQGRTPTLEFARRLFGGPDFVRDTRDLALFQQYEAFLRTIESIRVFDVSVLGAAIESTFDSSPQLLVDSASFRSDARRLLDSIVVFNILSSEDGSKLPTLLSQLVRTYRAVDLIEAVAIGDPAIDGLSVRAWRATPLELPEEIWPLPPKLPTTDSQNSGTTSTPVSSRSEISSKVVALEDAIDDLLSLRSEDVDVLLSDEASVSNARDLEEMRIKVASLEQAVSALGRVSDSEVSTNVSSDPVSEKLAFASATLAVDTSKRERLAVRTDSLARLRSSTRERLEEFQIDLGGLSVPVAVERLEKQSERLAAELAELPDPPPEAAILRVGHTALPASLVYSNSAEAVAPGGPNSLAATSPSEPPPIYAIGNLLLTSMNIIRYEAGEVAHIENVLVGEVRERETRRLRRTEDTLFRETETTKEEERDLQTTERLEMQREAQNTIRESENLNVGASISAGYGPFVQASFNTQYGNQSSQEDMTRNASSYSREIVEKTSSKITERIREEQTIRVIQEFEERNLHRMSGEGRDEHIVGLFQWIDKVYRAQVFDYGIRLICEVVVPEPARFLQRAVFMEQLHQKNALVPPPPIDFGPYSISKSDYTKYAKIYGVKGLQPPPAAVITLSATFQSENKGPEGEEEEGQDTAAATTFTNVRELKIPNGYKAVEGYATAFFSDAYPAKGGIPFGLTIRIGRAYFPFINPDNGGPIKANNAQPLNDEVENIPVTLLASGVTHYAASVEIKCYRTSRAFRQWQIQTFEAILDSYKALETDYRERVAELAAQEGITFSGRNPAENRNIERMELKRLAISVLTENHLSNFGAYLTTAPVPHIDFEKAHEQGKTIRFFERLFEWENMTYEFFPYFWSDKHRWSAKLLAEDTDPLHKAFHQSGAALVRLVVRPDFESLFFHFKNTGNIWQGADLPSITNPVQSDLMAEILARREAEDPHQIVPRGQSWEVRLPTTLVRVSPTGQLPQWEADEDGNFSPVADA